MRLLNIKCYLGLIIVFLGISIINSQEIYSKQTNDNEVEKYNSDLNQYPILTDTTKIYNFKEPTNRNIGLTNDIVGIDLISGDIPVSYNIYPLIPLKLWTIDTGLLGGGINNVGESAIEYGKVGYTVGVINNPGVPINRNIVRLASNNFGKIDFSATSMGEISKFLMYSATIKGLFDPGSTNSNIGKYNVDQTKSIRFSLSKAFKHGGTFGIFGGTYKYHESKGIIFDFIPFIYKKDGSVEKANNLELGKSSYLENSGKILSRNPFTDKIDEFNLLDPKFTSHTIDLFNYTSFPGDWNWNNSLKLLFAKGGIGVNSSVASLNSKPGDYAYLNYNNPSDKSKDYTRDGLFLNSTALNYETPFKYFVLRSSLDKKLDKHKIKATLSNEYFNIDNFIGTSSFYFLALEKNPSKLIPKNTWADLIVNKDGNIPGADNTRLEYIDGYENKSAFILSEKYEPNDKFNLNLSTRLELHKLEGTYAPVSPKGTQDIDNARPGSLLNKDKFKKVNNTKLNKSLNLDLVWKFHYSNEKDLVEKERIIEYGILANTTYQEHTPGLMAYSNGLDFDYKKNIVYNAEFGGFYRNTDFNIIAKAIYMKNTNYMPIPASSIISPYSPFITAFIQPVYDVESYGAAAKMSIDSIATGLKIDFGVTLQESKYKKYSGDITFSDGNKTHYDYSGNRVTGVSNAVLDLYMRYIFPEKKELFRIWIGGKYYSKPFANKSNTLKFKERYETSAGVNYYPIKFMSIGLQFDNLLNQVYPLGSIGLSDLMTDTQINNRIIDKAFTSMYVMPFTTSLSITYVF